MHALVVLFHRQCRAVSFYSRHIHIAYLSNDYTADVGSLTKFSLLSKSRLLCLMSLDYHNINKAKLWVLCGKDNMYKIIFYIL